MLGCIRAFVVCLCVGSVSFFTPSALAGELRPKDVKPIFVSNVQNTIWYDHRNLTFVTSCSSPSSRATTSSSSTADDHASPLLRVAHGKPFVVRVCSTDPRRFKIVVSAIKEAEGPPETTLETTAGVRTLEADLRNVQVMIRHSNLFQRYHVSIKKIAPEESSEDHAKIAHSDFQLRSYFDKRDDAELRINKALDGPIAVDLVGVEFDVLVDTKADWAKGFSGGLTFSNLTSKRYYLKKDNKGTADTADDSSTVELDPKSPDSFRPDTIVLASLQFPLERRFNGLGMAFGLGIGDNSQARFFGGVSYTLGRSFILTAGWTGGHVDELPRGQKIGESPIAGDTTLNNMDKPFRSGFYAGLAFAFIKRDDVFVAQFEAKSESKPAKIPAETKNEKDDKKDGDTKKP